MKCIKCGKEKYTGEDTEFTRVFDNVVITIKDK